MIRSVGWRSPQFNCNVGDGRLQGVLDARRLKETGCSCLKYDDQKFGMAGASIELQVPWGFDKGVSLI